MTVPPDYDGSAYDSIKNALGFERQKVEAWKQFRAETGHWPVASIVFRYTALLVLLTSVITLLYFLDQRDLQWLEKLAGAAWIVFLVILWVSGEWIIEKLERKRYSRS